MVMLRLWDVLRLLLSVRLTADGDCDSWSELLLLLVLRCLMSSRRSWDAWPAQVGDAGCVCRFDHAKIFFLCALPDQIGINPWVRLPCTFRDNSMRCDMLHFESAREVCT